MLIAELDMLSNQSKEEGVESKRVLGSVQCVCGLGVGTVLSE